MNQKTLILLGTILLAFIAIAVVPSMFKKDDSQKQLKNVSVDMSDFSPQTVNKIEFGQGEEKKTLESINGQWQIDGQEADQAKAMTFLAEIENSEVLKQASKNDENHKKFKVTLEDGTTLVIFQNGEPNEFYIGKTGPSFGTFYIRKKGIKNVYLMRGGFNENLDWVEEEWKKDQPKEEPDETEEEVSEL